MRVTRSSPHPPHQVSDEEVIKLLSNGIEPVDEIDPCFAEFTYTPRSLPDDSTPTVSSSFFVPPQADL